MTAPRAPRRPTARPVSTPRPPAQPSRPVAGAAHQCVYKGTAPCDPIELGVSAEYSTTKERGIRIYRKLRGSAPRGTPGDVARLLHGYDLVIDTIAGYHSLDDGAPKAHVLVRAETQVHGRCGLMVHPNLSIGRVVGGTRASATALAAAPLVDQVPGSTILGFFGFIAALWPTHDPLHLEVRTRGCGKRAANAGDAVGELVGLVRIFRAGKWSAKITLPATGAFKDEKSGKFHRGGGAPTRTTTATGLLSHALPNNAHNGWDPRAYAAEVRQKLSVKVERNGVELQGGQRITKLIAAIVDYRDTCQRIFILLQSSPQFGWKFEGKVSLLEGSFEAKWEPEVLYAPEAGGRWLPVRNKLEITANLKLIDAEATISFGVLAESEVLASKLEARIEGSIGLSVSTSVIAPFAARRDPLELRVTTRGFIRARAVGTATVLGKTIADASAEVVGAIALKNGRVLVTGKGMGFRGSLATEKVTLKVEASLGGLGPTSVDFDILPEKELMKWDDTV